ncbi:MAG: hypothetical protein HZB62_09115 [Nitrospirae bacterium]|nr:hypothetical protein [Nitrospirota bacterium]
MEKYYQDKLAALAIKIKDDIGEQENNVKYKFVIPFLECFGYNQEIDFEHASQGNRLDIFIDSIAKHCILVEVKGYSKNLDDFIHQLKRYCDEKRPILAVLMNGEEIQFYSPFWRTPNFSDTLIYAIRRKDLGNPELVERIEKILLKDNLKNHLVEKYIQDREREIEDARRAVAQVDDAINKEGKQIESKIFELNDGIENIRKQIQELSSRREALLKDKAGRSDEILKSIYFERPAKKRIVASELQITEITTNRPPTADEPPYIENYRRQLKNPSSLVARVLMYIANVGRISRSDMQKACVSELGCRSESSGSINASIKVLEVDGYIKIEGAGNNKQIVYTGKNYKQ